MAVILTATAGGVVNVETGAAMVIGANVGTTSTALLSVIGATPNAKRVAAAHIAFNLLTGIVALIMLPFILSTLERSRDVIGLASGPAAGLALFHTVFNLLGVLLMSPATPALVRRLERAFASIEEEEARPVYLDQNVLVTPVLAIQALALELDRAAGFARRLAITALGEAPSVGRIDRDRVILERIVDSALSFANQIQRSSLPADVVESVPTARRAAVDLIDLADLSVSVATTRASLQPVAVESIAGDLSGFRGRVWNLLETIGDDKGESNAHAVDLIDAINEEYRSLKERLVRSAQDDQLPTRIMIDRLDLFRDIHRMGLQYVSAMRRLSSIASVQTTSGEPEV
jgi:phosphate:Na+ symporter